MTSDIIVIGGGASGLMAAWGAAKQIAQSGHTASVTVLEKMPRPARKIMITGKGRCNFTNLKDWNAFSAHLHPKANFIRPAFYNFPPEKVIEFFEKAGVRTQVERGDRAFPCSYHASDIIDALSSSCKRMGVKIECSAEVRNIFKTEDGFEVELSDGGKRSSRKLIIATGGLCYPTTGSSGDGYAWAREAGHKIIPTFPSLTALVPDGYKTGNASGHIDRSTPLSSWGESLCGLKYKFANVTLKIDSQTIQSETGELYFTDGGIEGPIGFQLSRKAVKALVNGSKVVLEINGKDYPIRGYVGYERAVVTAGGVCTDELLPKTMESRLSEGLYFCGEIIDMDADTGGYNLQSAFCTGVLAGESAAKAL